MKKLISILFFSLLLVFTASAQLDRSIRPEPAPAREIQLGDFESFTLDNGLQVIVVENRQVPVVSFSIRLDRDPIIEGDAKGYVSLAGALMQEGTINRSKQQIDEEVDFIGASLNTFATGMFGSSLKRHQEILLELMQDILLNPTFPEEELQRRLTQSRSGFEASRNDANFIAGNISTVTRHGDHPYGEVQTPEHLDNITTDLLREYYKTYFRPNIAYLIIVGDIDKAEAKKLSEKYFGSWKKGNVPTTQFPTPKGPEGTRVAFGARSGATQSVVRITYPLEFTPGNPDAIKASAMNTILGGGAFFGRLMQNIREDKGWTYGSYSSLNSDRLIGSFSAGAEVRNSVTDSTVIEILGEMRRIIEEPVDESTLQMVKNFMSGNFGRSLERPQTIAEFAYNIKRYNLPEDYYATYLQKLNAVTVQDIQDMARKYLKPDNAIIVVAGNIDEVPETLTKFSATGEVEFFDPFGRPVAPPQELDGDITAEQVIEAYIKAIGGKENLLQVEDMVMKMGMEAGPGMTLDMIIKQKKPNMFFMSMAMGGNVMMKQVFDGEKGLAEGMGQRQQLQGDELEALKAQAIMFPELEYGKDGYNLELAGIEAIDGMDAYRVRVTTPNGQTKTDYFCIETGLKLRSLSTQDGGPMGQMTVTSEYADYREVKGIMVPFAMKQGVGPQVMNMKASEVLINSGLSSDEFKVE
jgi:predicted Zn-dependent peptidase